MAGKSHKDVDFEVGAETFKTFNEAAAYALSLATARGEATLDIVVHSEAGARWLGGSHGVEQYREDPEASVHERLQIKVNSQGRVA